MEKQTYTEIAVTLNERGFKPGGVKRYGNEQFTARTVSRLSRDHNLTSRFDRLRTRGLLTRAEIMEKLDISASSLRNWAKHGIVVEHRCDGRSHLYEDPGPNPPRKALGRLRRRVLKQRTYHVWHSALASVPEAKPSLIDVEFRLATLDDLSNLVDWNGNPLSPNILISTPPIDD